LGERDETKRAEYEAEITGITETKRYYVDESGINKYLYREYGYALRGVKVYGKVQGKKFERLNIVAAKCGDKIIGQCEYRCNMNSALFELWFCEVLLKLLPAGSVIILDNASWHRRKVLTVLAEAVDCRVIFLPPYSPDFNPIEKVWAALKKFIRNYLRDFHSLSTAINHFFQVP
jgi:transposase